MDSPEGLRLRLMTLLSLYDLLPYSISNPPFGTTPQSLDEAIGTEAVHRCLDAMARLHPQQIPVELSNILRDSKSGNVPPAGKSHPRFPTKKQSSTSSHQSSHQPQHFH